MCAAKSPFYGKIFVYLIKKLFLCISIKLEINIINILKIKNYVRNRIKSKGYYR